MFPRGLSLVVKGSYQSIAAFLKNKVPALSELPDEALMNLAHAVEVDYLKCGTVFIVQGETELSGLFVVNQGAVELFDEQDDGEHELLAEGGLYGALSLLRNNGLALRSAKTVEDTYFYRLPKGVFFQLCADHEDVRDYFFDSLRTRAYERSLAALSKQRLLVPPEHSVMHLSVEDVMDRRYLSCVPGDTIRSAASAMVRADQGYILVVSDDRVEGIFTDRDLRREVVAGDLSRDASVGELMNTPVHTGTPRMTVLEALMEMLRLNIAYMPIVAEGGKPLGILSALAVPQVRQQEPLNLIHHIGTQSSSQSLAAVKKRLPSVVGHLFEEGYGVAQVSHFITHINDAVLVRLVDLAVAQLGEAPCEFAFIALGSEGRGEQTLLVDQDNGIIYEDAAPPTALAYFRMLGDLVCTWLDEAGYSYCKGKLMASNPDWCQPLGRWVEYFRHWFAEPEPEALMHAQTFFDFRVIAGDPELGKALRDHLEILLKGRMDLFFRVLATRYGAGRPPMGFFRNFIVASKGEHKNELDLKKTMNFVVDFARLYAFKYRLEEVNTLDRLRALHDLEVLTDLELETLERGYAYMMSLRLHHQLEFFMAGHTENGNYLNPYTLSQLSQDMLKAVFKQLGHLQRKVAVTFIAPV